MCRLVQSLGLMFILAWPLEAGENSWSYTPVMASDQLMPSVELTSDPNILYSANFRDLLRSNDGGRHWSHLEAPPGTSPLEIDPLNPDVLFRLYYENLMRSSDGGKSWVPVLHITPYMSARVLASSHFPGRVYVISKEAIWQSRDGGATFSLRSRLQNPEVANVFELEEAADGGLYLRRYNTCLQHCPRSWRIERSRDEGETWTQLFGGDSLIGTIFQAIPHPTQPEVVYFVSPGARLLYSEDRGASTVDLGQLPGFGPLRTDETRPDTLLQVGSLTLHRSNDRGVSWQQVTMPGHGLTEGSIASGPRGRLVFYQLRAGSFPATGAQAYISGDAGSSWTPLEVESFVARTVEHITLAGPEGVLYVSYGGSLLHRSDDGGDTWQRLENPFISGFLTGDPADGDTIYLQGYGQGPVGLFRSRDGGQTFSHLGDFGDFSDLVAVRRGQATHLIAASRDGRLARSPDGGDSWLVLNPPVIVPHQENVLFEQLAVSGTSVYALAAGKVYGSEDAGATWSYRGNGDLLAAGGGVLALFESQTNTIQVSTTGGPPFTKHSVPFPAYQYLYGRSWLLADKHGALYLLASSMVLRSVDQGRTWQSLTQGLPELTYFPKLLVHPTDRNQLYWAETPGLYRGTFADRGTLALLRGRFEARLRWRTSAQAEWTSGTAAVTSDQSGFFHLFTPERAEVAVQMLDGRVLGGRFWVFVASMTDVEIEVEILDRVEGEIWRHHQPLGEMRSAADLSAFPRQPEPISGALPLPFGGIFEPQPVVTLDDLFDISVSWIANGEINVAQGRRLLGDTAAFTFFDPSAVDVIINIIDGRSINGKYWVFGGSLTDVQFVVTIKNRETGVIKTIHNPPGAFAGFSDNEAF